MSIDDTILAALTVTAELIGTQFSPAAYDAMLDELEQYPEKDVLAALHRCRRECRGRLALADILERLPGTSKMGPEAAWNEALRKQIWREDITVVTRRAIFCSFPFDTWEEQDKVAARVGFIETYPGNLAIYGDEVHVSLGRDSAGRKAAISEAVQTGLITHERGVGLVPELAYQESGYLLSDERRGMMRLGEQADNAVKRLRGNGNG